VQFPFTVWLTDAASSAIPVLALAAATVAPLGLYLVARATVAPSVRSAIHIV
jgi:NADH:ubiquinone oxidoreductase subunit 5 (subunit L)/multisubunit Na+/H+ antiporter MnhA subunit